ncbi:MAG: flagellar motor switch phosphatase FliY [Tuberibacillus sp.]
MSNNAGMLSQEEIDALLGGSNLANAKEQTATNDIMTPMEMDAIGEIGNISFGSASTALSTLLNQKVEITTPTVTVIKKADFKEEFPYPHVSVHVEYTEGFKGSNVLLIKEEDASIIADLMLGGSGHPSNEINEIHLSAVQEAMNQMMGSSATSMSMLFDKRIDISPPKIEMLNVKEDKGTEQIPNEEYFVKVSFKLRVGDLIDSNIMQLMPIDFCKELVTSMVMNDDLADEFISSNADPLPQAAQNTFSHVEEASGFQNESDRTPTPNINPNGVDRAENGASTNRIKESAPVNVQPAMFTEFNTADNRVGTHNNIDLLLDIPLKVTVELGQTKKSIKDILDLSPGSVIELDKLAGEPVDVLINHKPIAKGEVVVIDENFGVRITEIINKRDRLEKLN